MSLVNNLTTAKDKLLNNGFYRINRSYLKILKLNKRFWHTIRNPRTFDCKIVFVLVRYLQDQVFVHRTF